MALTEETNYDKIEVVGVDKFGIQLRQATVVAKDGVQLSKTFTRHAITHGYYSPDGTYNQTDLSGYPTDVQAIINATWTSDVVTKWKASADSLNPSA
jgi:hypothetical protein